MGVGWHHSSNVNIWVLTSLGISPVIVESRLEGGIWMGVVWHWSPDVWAWVLLTVSLGIKLDVGPVVVKGRGEG